MGAVGAKHPAAQRSPGEGLWGHGAVGHGAMGLWVAGTWQAACCHHEMASGEASSPHVPGKGARLCVRQFSVIFHRKG